MSSQRRIVRVVVKGGVQRVGFRMWVEREALTRGVEGWIRNRADGAVEGVFAGADEAVVDLVDACRQGPAKARVTGVEFADAQAESLNLRAPGVAFDVLATL